jgi:trk system potassium uptake protein
VLLRPDHEDLRVIGLYTGRVVLGVGAVMLLPAAYGLVRQEWNEAASLVIGGCLGIAAGLVAELRLATRRDVGWQHGMVIAGLSWLAAPLIGAVPLYLSGHYGTFLGAYYDAMSGFATAGLSVMNDLDHLADSLNLWRHLTHFLGGQGLVLLVLSTFAGGGGSIGMYVGEARDQKIVPNVARTSRFIWRVSLAWFAVGGTALFAALLVAGVPLAQAPLHAVTLFMAAFDTGGFAPNSAGIGLYHSAVLEVVLGVLMVAGALSFALHYQLWQRHLGELVRNTEVRLLTASTLALFALTAVGLARTGTYDSVPALLRRGLFHVVSAHTGTGFASVPGGLFVTDWGTLAPAAIVAAMAMGAMAGSTAGGIKAIRIGIVLTALRGQLRRLRLPPDAVTVDVYHSGGRQLLTEPVLRAALMILLLYLGVYLLGALAYMFHGHPFDQALFESTSAAAAVGLSVGLTGPSMPADLMAVAIMQMWVGRLEFIAVLALFGFAWSTLRARV